MSVKDSKCRDIFCIRVRIFDTHPNVVTTAGEEKYRRSRSECEVPIFDERNRRRRASRRFGASDDAKEFGR